MTSTHPSLRMQSSQAPQAHNAELPSASDAPNLPSQAQQTQQAQRASVSALLAGSSISVPNAGKATQRPPAPRNKGKGRAAATQTAGRPRGIGSVARAQRGPAGAGEALGADLHAPHGEGDLLWVDLHAPHGEGDLIVHVKKVQEVRQWLEGQRATLGMLGGNRLLFVTGEAGGEGFQGTGSHECMHCMQGAMRVTNVYDTSTMVGRLHSAW